MNDGTKGTLKVRNAEARGGEVDVKGATVGIGLRSLVEGVKASGNGVEVKEVVFVELKEYAMGRGCVVM